MTMPDTVYSHVLAERRGGTWVLHALDFALTVEARTIEAGYGDLTAEIRRRLQFAARAGDVMAAFERFEDQDVYARFRAALLAAQRAALTGAAAADADARAIAMALPTAAEIAAPPKSLADDHKKLDDLSRAAKRWAGDDAFKRRRLVAAILE
ncbi:MAG: hypothetical protein J4F33_08900 [Alphaproteobacteria bacterium]|nr:hypothetical protein [Alphaproteobacteria bacterium]